MPDLSQYIQIKRLQTGINGRIANTKTKRANDTYEGYAGSGLTILPPNALLSNKFIIPETGDGGGGGGEPDCSNLYTLTLVMPDGDNIQLVSTTDEFTISASSFCIGFGGKTTGGVGQTILGINLVFDTSATITASNISITPDTPIQDPVITTKDTIVTFPLTFVTPISDASGIKVAFSNITAPVTVLNTDSNKQTLSLSV